MQIHYSGNPEIILGKQIAVIGFGSQGHAHALNLKDSGANVVVGLRPDSSSVAEASSQGLTVHPIEKAVEWADVIMLLVPDQHHKSVYNESIARHLHAGKALGVGHGFSIHYKEIVPPDDIDVFMVAPKSPGHLVRRTFEDGKGVPCLVAVAQDASGSAMDLAVSYAGAIGGLRAGVIETNFKDETETDLFGEQAVLCGGTEALIKAGFDTLVEAGYPAELAYFEVLHELKLIVDLLYEGGPTWMNYSISDTAEYGNYTRGPVVIDEGVRDRMRGILKQIQSGEFAREWIDECDSGGKRFDQMRASNAGHRIEEVGRRLRSMMSWVKSRKADSASESVPAKDVSEETVA
ncbi:MAG: ketol-acid reductoisomerase [Candidatus Latescibacterota bacterium]|jgi:ketol-acid reductoisomerase